MNEQERIDYSRNLEGDLRAARAALSKAGTLAAELLIEKNEALSRIAELEKGYRRILRRHDDAVKSQVGGPDHRVCMCSDCIIARKALGQGDKTGWLQRRAKEIDAEAETWPDWMKKAARVEKRGEGEP